jgi:two-component system response regulator DevR
MGKLAPGGVIRVMLVDDHEVVRLGLISVIQLFPRMSVVAQAGSVAEAIVEARRSRPDVVLMDVRLPDGDGIEACRQIRAENSRVQVLMLTSYSEREALHASIMAGAVGYLLKRSQPERLIEAVIAAAEGRSQLDPEVTGMVLELMRAGVQEPDPLRLLSPQERKILPLIAQGKTNREIAEELCLSWHTVKAHVSNVLRKLNVVRRIELAKFSPV